MEAGLYIHIPFCQSRCVYCGFYSTVHPDWQDRYVGALCREMDLLAARGLFGGASLQTIYLGGGTPSMLSRANMERLFANVYKVYPVAPSAEITVECNPDDIRPGMFASLPVNRVSMGAQTFDDRRLRFLGRRHSAAQVGSAVDTLRRDGITNISLDLMFGFPDETLAQWDDDLRQALALRPEHLSAYGLMVEEGTPLHRLCEQGRVREADEEVCLSMYDRLVDRLAAAGYEHYEISNFARLDSVADAAAAEGVSPYRSRHNSSYWTDVPYIGLGAAAHSYDRQARRWNPSDIVQYMDSIEQGRLPFEEEPIDAVTHYNDLVTTALRMREGIDINRLDDKHRTFLLRNARGYMERGLLRLDGHRLHLTHQGISISNTIMSDLMDV